MSVFAKIEQARLKEYLGGLSLEEYKDIETECEEAIVSVCKNLNPARNEITTEEIGGAVATFHKKYQSEVTNRVRKLLIQNLQKQGLEVHPYIKDNKIQFKLVIPQVSEVYHEGLKGIEGP